ncbi:MAG: GNAT family N-acetyltransferase [Bacteroidota bacterium]
MELKSERLYYRKFRQEDASNIYDLDTDPQVMTFLGGVVMKNIQDANATIQRLEKQYAEHQIGRYAVFEIETNSFVGWSGLMFHQQLNGLKDVYELGYRFIQSSWGKGYATESGRFWLEYGFSVLDQQTLYAMAAVKHQASIRVLEKLQFENEGPFEIFGHTHYFFSLNKD